VAWFVRGGRTWCWGEVIDPVFEGKLVIALGERDGVAGPAIAACAKAAGGEVVLSATECFV
jgi:betaine reductase